MRSIAQGLWQTPAFGLVAETIGYLLSVMVAAIVIKALAGMLVTEYGKIILGPIGQVVESKAQVKAR